MNAADLFLHARMMGMTLGINMIKTNMIHMTLVKEGKQMQRRITMDQLKDARFDIMDEEFRAMARELNDAARY